MTGQDKNQIQPPIAVVGMIVSTSPYLTRRRGMDK